MYSQTFAVMQFNQNVCPLPASPDRSNWNQGPDPQPALEAEDEYPDGGKEAWLIVFGSWCAMIPSMGLLNSLAVLQAWLSEHHLRGMPESTTGWIFSGYAFFLFFCGAQIGKHCFIMEL